jgi:RNA polymerase sigma factor (sigma-70 family)
LLGLEPDQLLAHSAWVRALARSLLADDALADDVVQETWTATLGRAPRSPDRIRAWLAAITANLARGLRRERARRAARELAAAVPERTPSAAEVAEQEAERRRVVDVVLGLHEPYRETLLLRFWCDLEPAVIASRQGVSSSTVRNRLRRALALVRAELERERPGQTARTLHALALAWPCPVAGGLGATGGAASLTGVLAMTAKLKLVTAATVLGIAGAATWALLPGHEPEGAPNETPLRPDVETTSLAGLDRVPAREPLAPAARVPASPPQPATTRRREPLAPGIVVVGDVTDADGRAIDGASIRLRNARGEERTATTQDGLGFVLARLTPGEWEIACQAPRHRHTARTVTLAADREQVDFTLEPAVMLGVRVLTPDGKPLPEELEKGEHAVGFLLRDSLFPIATTAPPGATIPWVVPGEPFGVARVEPRGERHRPGPDWVLHCEAPLPLEVSLVLRDRVLATRRVEAPATEVTLVVAPEQVRALATTVRLKVVDAASGEPLASASLSLANGKSSTSGRQAAADGTFELAGEPFGILALWIHAKGYEQRFVQASPAPGAVLDLGTITLPRATSVAGRVTGPTGGRAAWLHVWPLEAVEPGVPLMTQIVHFSAAADGAFDLPIGPGRHLILVRPRGGEGVAARVVDVPAAAVRDLEIAVRPGVRVTLAPELPGGTVLRVVDATGVPVWAELAARERRTVHLSAGRYTLEAHGERGLVEAVPFVVRDQPVSVRIGH